MLDHEIRAFALENRLEFNEEISSYQLRGEYNYDLSYNNHIYSGSCNLILQISKRFPSEIPKLFLLERPPNMEHFFSDGSACLATVGELTKYLVTKPSFTEFFNDFIHPFIFTTRWFLDFNSYPFGERSHGLSGILDFYVNDCELSVESLQEMFRIVKYKKYRGHNYCFCGSEKKLRKCHGQEILSIMNDDVLRNTLIQEYDYILQEVKRYVKE